MQFYLDLTNMGSGNAITCCGIPGCGRTNLQKGQDYRTIWSGRVRWFWALVDPFFHFFRKYSLAHATNRGFHSPSRFTGYGDRGPVRINDFADNGLSVQARKELKGDRP